MTEHRLGRRDEGHVVAGERKGSFEAAPLQRPWERRFS
jgi:hypothetical protein